MGLSGYEVLVMTSISPIILGIGPLRRFLINHLRITYILSLTGFVAFYYKQPEYRLFVTGAGVGFSCLALTAGFFAERSNPARLDGRISGFSLGLLASSITKFACYTNNPVWPVMHAENGGWNKTGLGLAAIAVLISTRKGTHAQDISAAKSKNGPFILISLGLAGMFFAFHSLLADSSTMISWVWDGYPITGPMAVPDGVYVLLAMGFGHIIGSYFEAFGRSWTFFGVGSVAVGVFYANHGWLGFYGALVFATYMMAIAPSFIRVAIQHGPAKTFGTAFLFYNLLVLANIWTVAYAFVPGGPLLRERTDLVTSAMMVCIGAGVFATTSFNNSSNGKPLNSKHTSPIQRRVKSYFMHVLVALELVAIAIAYIRSPPASHVPYNKEHKVVSAGIWTVHFGIDNDMWSSERRMRDLIKEMEVDIIGMSSGIQKCVSIAYKN